MVQVPRRRGADLRLVLLQARHRRQRQRLLGRIPQPRHRLVPSPAQSQHRRSQGRSAGPLSAPASDAADPRRAGAPAEPDHRRMQRLRAQGSAPRTQRPECRARTLHQPCHARRPARCPAAGTRQPDRSRRRATCERSSESTAATRTCERRRRPTAITPWRSLY